MQVRLNLAFSQTAFYLYVTLIMAQDAPKRRFLSLVFLVLCISKSFLIRLLKLRQQLHLWRSDTGTSLRYVPAESLLARLKTDITNL